MENPPCVDDCPRKPFAFHIYVGLSVYPMVVLYPQENGVEISPQFRKETALDRAPDSSMVDGTPSWVLTE